MAEPVALVRALDQAGHVGDHRGPLLVQRQHTQVRAGGGERECADLRLRRRQRRQQGGLARVRRTHQADIGDQLQLELDPALLARRSLLVVGRGPMGRRHEVDVAPPAAPAVGDDQAVASAISSPSSRPASSVSSSAATRTTVPGGTSSSRPMPFRPWARRPVPLPPGLARKCRLPAVVGEGGHPRVDDQADIPAVAAITAVRPATWNVRLAAKGGGTVAAGTGGHEDPRMVSEHRQPIIPMGSDGSVRVRAAPSPPASGRGVATGSAAG